MTNAREIATDALTGFALGADISREDVWQLIVDVIEADRAQRDRYVLSFEPDAIRDHFEADDDDPTVDVMDEQLFTVAEWALQDDRLYRLYHELLTEGLDA